MYRTRTRGYSKKNPVMRWALPDRVFFACGACHILASAFVERYGTDETKILRLKPETSDPANHIVVATDLWVFDYHGYSERERYLAHTSAKALRWWPNWRMKLVELPPEVLLSESASRTYEGLWLREPTQFLHDAMPRARLPRPLSAAAASVGRKSAAHSTFPAQTFAHNE